MKRSDSKSRSSFEVWRTSREQPYVSRILARYQGSSSLLFFFSSSWFTYSAALLPSLISTDTMSAPGGAPSPAPRSGSIGPGGNGMSSMPQQSVNSPASSGPHSGGSAMSQQNLNQIVSSLVSTILLFGCFARLQLCSCLSILFSLLSGFRSCDACLPTSR